MMNHKNSFPYTSKIIKAGALIADTKTMLASWDDSLSVNENLRRFRYENIFGKASRSRVDDILTIFRQRYLFDEGVINALITCVRDNLPAESLDRILYFYSTQSDALLHDIVTNLLFSKYERGRLQVTVEEVEAWIRKQISLGKTQRDWSEKTITRSAQEILSALRDFGVLQGIMTKRIAPAYLPIRAFAFVAFVLWQNSNSGRQLLEHSEWRLFFLSDQAVERCFIEAQQHHLLIYQAAGSVARVDFPVNSLEKYARVITG